MGSAFSWEIMLDYYPGSSLDGLDMAVIPTASLIWGRMFNLGLGAGMPYYKLEGAVGEFGDIAFLLQAGAVLPMGDTLSFNLALFSYFEDFGDISDIGADTLTLAARLFSRF